MRDPNFENDTALCCTERTQNAAGKRSASWMPAFLMGVLGAVMLLFPMEAGVSFACLMTVGMLAFLMPLLGWFTLVTVWGAYLLVSAVAAAAASVSQNRTDTAA